MATDAPSAPLRFPDEFSYLEPWAALAISDHTDRSGRRESSSLDELRELYDAVSPHLETILDHLDQHRLDALTAREEALLWLTFSFVEAAAAVELYDRPAVSSAYPASRFRFEVVRP